jgi:hypothetical protein
MTLKLSDELRQALAQPTPPRLLDEQTNTAYILIREDLYERLRALLDDDEFDVREAYPLMDEVARREGWDDPELDVYNDLLPRQGS